MNSFNNRLHNEHKFAEANPRCYDWLTAAEQQNNSFVQSLYQQVERKGELSEKQLACIERNLAKANQPKQEPVSTGTIDLSDVLRRFELAKTSGIKRPRINLGDLVFSMAGDNSRNAGCVYVKGGTAYEAEYYGKVDPQGNFFAARGLDPEIAGRIINTGADLFATARAHGMKHNNCCFCSRELKTLESVSLGWGPICAERYGLPHDIESAKQLRPEFFEARDELSRLNKGER